MKVIKFIRLFVGVGLLFAASTAFAEELPPPYNEIEVLPADYHGWFHNADSLEEIFENESITTVIEVGSWLGKSAMWMAERLPEDGKLYAVDHWLGSAEHQPGKKGHHRAVPYLYQQFLSNVIHRGLAHKIVPVRMPSLEAAKVVSVKPDLIYIDASHQYHEVLQDLEAWYPLAGSEAVFCGDDWRWPQVRRAVMKFAQTHGLEVTSRGTFWRVFSP